MKILKSLFKEVIEVCFMLFLYLATTSIIFIIIYYWLSKRLIHNRYYWMHIIPTDCQSSVLNILNYLYFVDEEHANWFWIFTIAISIINYTIMNVKLYNYKGKSQEALKFLGKYFCLLLLVITNLRFLGDLGNHNVDKMGWYFIFVAIPTYLQLLAFSIVFAVVIRKRKNSFTSNIVYTILNNYTGKIIMYLSILYLTYYTMGCLILAICLKTDIYSNYFYSFDEMSITNTIQKFCFDNGIVVSINLGIFLISTCIYTYIIKSFKLKNNQSYRNGFFYTAKIFTILMMFSATIKYVSDYIYPTTYFGEITIGFMYWPLMITCILLLLILHSYKKKGFSTQSDDIQANSQ